MKNANILIVEDSAAVAEDIKGVLIKMGYQIAGICSTGEEAIKMASSERPDIFLVDIQLAGDLDGTAAAQVIHDKYHIPIIYLTALLDDETFRRARTTEPYGFLTKPLDETQLKTTLELALYNERIAKLERENEQWLTVMLKSIGDAVVATDANGNVKFMNKLAEDLTGWSQSLAVGRDFDEIICLRARNPEKNISSPVKTMISTLESSNIERGTTLVSKSGREYLIDDSGSPMFDAEGNLCGTVIVFRDVTEEIKMEEEVAAALRASVISQLADRITHEVNNPAEAILLYLTMAMEDSDNAGVSDKIGKALRQIKRLSRLTKWLRDFSSNTRSEDDKSVGLSHLLQQVVGIFEESFETREIGLQLSFPEVLPNVCESAESIRSIVSCVLNMEYSRLNQGDSVYVEVRESKNRTVIAIEDNGMWLGPVPNEIFDTDSSFNQTISTGARIARDICEGMGGEMVARNKLASEGSGVCFEISLPLRHELDL